MGKNKKQKLEWKCLHDDLAEATPNLKKKWRRQNFDIGKKRAKRNKIKEQDFYKEFEE